MKIDLQYGDCLELMKDIPDQSVDLILCDLPYGTTACKWDAVIPFDNLWDFYLKVLKPRGVIVLTASQPFTSALIMSNIKMFRYEWVWQKNAGSNFGSVKYQPMKEHESVVVFYDKNPTYNPVMQERAESGKNRVRHAVRSNTTASDGVYGVIPAGEPSIRSGMRYPSSIQKFNRERGAHPTQKPVALMEYLIKTYTNEGDTVLDNCMGSGTTGVACVNTMRNFIGMEQEFKYFRIACRRIKEAGGEL